MAEEEIDLDGLDDLDEESDDSDELEELEESEELEDLEEEELEDLEDEEIEEDSSKEESTDLALDEGEESGDIEELDPSEGSLPDPEEASQTIELGQKVQTDPIEKYNGSEGMIDRAGVFTKRVDVVKTHWHDDLGRFYAFPEANEVLGMPQVHYVIPICLYDTDQKGKLRSKDVDIQFLRLSDGRYDELMFAADDDGEKLVGSDIKIKCTDEKYQEFKYNLCDKALFKKSDEIKRNLKEKAEKALPHLESAVARKITPEQFFEEVGGAANTEVDATDEFALDD